MSWNLLVVLVTSAAVCGVAGGIPLGIAIGHRTPPVQAPTDRRCGDVCALAALPRGMDVVFRRRPARRPAGHRPPLDDDAPGDRRTRRSTDPR